jgi:hypothetical protein
MLRYFRISTPDAEFRAPCCVVVVQHQLAPLARARSGLLWAVEETEGDLGDLAERRSMPFTRLSSDFVVRGTWEPRFHGKLGCFCRGGVKQWKVTDPVQGSRFLAVSAS